MQADQYLLSSLTRACKLNNDRVVTRLPIPKGLLVIILRRIQETFDQQPYLSLLLRTIISTTYFGLFRICELTKTSSGHAVLTKDVQIGSNKRKFIFVLRTSKTHNEGTRPQIVKIASSTIQKKHKYLPSNQVIPCPYELLYQYSKARPEYENENDQFFVLSDGTSVTATMVRRCLKQALKDEKSNEKLYSFSSLRSGRASNLLKIGLSVETIKRLGRWKSNAIFKYLKD